MFCGKCGNEITIDEKFCSKCGNPVSAKDIPVADAVSDVSDNASNNNSDNSSNNKSGNKGTKVLIIIGILVIVLLIALIVKLVLDKNKSDKKEPSASKDEKIVDGKPDMSERPEASSSVLSDITGYWELKTDGFTYHYSLDIIELEILDEGIIGYGRGTKDQRYRIGAEDVKVSVEDGVQYYYFVIPQLYGHYIGGDSFEVDMNARLHFDNQADRLIYEYTDIDTGNFFMVAEYQFKDEEAQKKAYLDSIQSYVGTWYYAPVSDEQREFYGDVEWYCELNADGTGRCVCDQDIIEFVKWEVLDDGSALECIYLYYNEKLGGYFQATYRLDIVDDNTLRTDYAEYYDVMDGYNKELLLIYFKR